MAVNWLTMYILTPRMRPYTLAVITYMIAFLLVALRSNNAEFLYYELTMMVIIAVIVFMDKRVQFSHVVLGGLAFWGFIHLAGGLVPVPASWTILDIDNPVLYNVKPHAWLPKYDQLVHAFGFGVALIAAFEALSAHLKANYLAVLKLNVPVGFALFFMAMGLGALNELIEFVAVISIANTNVGGYENTGWDLVSNAVGALLSLVYLKFQSRQNPA